MCKKSIPVAVLLLSLGLAQAKEIVWQKTLYYDSRYATAWQGDSTVTRNGLIAAGYKVLNADELKTWMNARIADKAFSVVVFCMDSGPDTVCETNTSSCTLRKYLDSGGKIVWYGDIPFYYQSNASAVNTTWGDNGAPGILGFNTSSAPRDSGNTATITPLGTAWGLTTTWTSQRPALPTITSNFEILAKDNAGNACAWVKHYLAGDTFRGFVRFRDTGGQAVVADIIRVAEYTSVKATNPTPANGATGVTMPLVQWSPGPFAIWHDVYFGTNPNPGEAERVAHQVSVMNVYYHMAGLTPGTTYYWRIDEVEADGTSYTGDVWSFTAAPVTAFGPTPRNGDKWIDPNSDLSWQPGQNAIKHDVYFSTDKAAVESRDAGALLVAGSAAATCEPGTLTAGTTYYWAVDETTVSGGKTPGEVWSFTTNSPGSGGVKGEYFNGMAPVGAPALVRVDPGINFTWGDPGGPGAPIGVDQFSARWTADLEILFEDTYTFITTSDDGARLWLNDQLIVDTWIDQGTTDHSSQPIHLLPGIYSLRMEYYENGGGAVAQLSWSSTTMARQIIPAGPLQLPLKAKAVYPANGDTNVPQDVILTWSAGEKAAQHAVYFGLDKDAVENATSGSAGIYQGVQAGDNLSFDPGGLEWNTAYYWRVDEVNDAAADSPWKGAVWSFTTADSIIVDNMESYDDADHRIFDTWLDNYGDDSGSIVGNDPAPFAEQTIVHGGKQSLPMAYNNGGAQHLFSEIVRTFDSTQNWTVNGVSDLSLWVRGYPAPTPVAVTETGGKMNLTGAGADIWNNSDEFTFAYKTLTGDGTMVARVVSNGTGSNGWAKGGVMIRDSLDGGSTFADMVITGATTSGNGSSFQYRLVANAGCGNTDAAAAIAPPYWVKIQRTGDAISGYVSTNGTTWTQMGTTQTLAMTAPVYIGICVTSHAAGEDRTFQFDSISSTGGVSGAWQGAVINSPQYNGAADLYVVVEDSSGKSAKASEPAGANVAAWTNVKFPLSGFSGVNLSKVKKLYIGVGDRNATAPGGSGRIFLDDIQVTKP